MQGEREGRRERKGGREPLRDHNSLKFHFLFCILRWFFTDHSHQLFKYFWTYETAHNTYITSLTYIASPLAHTLSLYFHFKSIEFTQRALTVMIIYHKDYLQLVKPGMTDNRSTGKTNTHTHTQYYMYNLNG